MNHIKRVTSVLRIQKVILLTLLLSHCNLWGTTEEGIEEKATVITQAVGAASFYNGLIRELNRQCNMKLAIALPILTELDYVLRKKTDYSFAEFVELFQEEEEYKLLVIDESQAVLKAMGGCSQNELKIWFADIVKPSYQNTLSLLKAEDRLYGLPQTNRSEEFLLQEFGKKVNNYKNLPLEEISDLAEALRSGLYVYSLLSYTDKVNIDARKAVELIQFLVEKSGDSINLYKLAKAQEMYDRSLALKTYSEAALEGNVEAQIWLGTYYACNKNKFDAMYWLNKAKESDETDARDIIFELEDLGKPTNCLDGWVY